MKGLASISGLTAHALAIVQFPSSWRGKETVFGVGLGRAMPLLPPTRALGA